MVRFMVSVGGVLGIMPTARFDGGVSASEIAPTVEALAVGRNSLSKTYYMVTKATMSVGARRFVEFVHSSVGRDILRRTGHVPSS